MSLDNTKLLDFLGEIEKELSRMITLIAVGGTAMTLLEAKPSTIDVDFTIPSEYYDEFEDAKKIVQPDYYSIWILGKLSCLFAYSLDSALRLFPFSRITIGKQRWKDHMTMV